MEDSPQIFKGGGKMSLKAHANKRCEVAHIHEINVLPGKISDFLNKLE